MSPNFLKLYTTLTHIISWSNVIHSTVQGYVMSWGKDPSLSHKGEYGAWCGKIPFLTNIVFTSFAVKHWHADSRVGIRGQILVIILSTSVNSKIITCSHAASSFKQFNIERVRPERRFYCILGMVLYSSQASWSECTSRSLFLQEDPGKKTILSQQWVIPKKRKL